MEKAIQERFVQAVREGDAEAIRRLVRQEPALLESLDAPWFDFDAPALVFTAWRNDREMLDLLLDLGADPNVASNWWAGGWTALQASVWSALPAEPALAEPLLRRGALLDAHSAAGLGRLDRLQELADKDPSQLDAPGPDGLRPLHFAKNPEIAAWLLEHGATLDARDTDHHGTPAQWAIQTRPEVARFLLDQGAQADIFLLAALGDTEALQQLLAENPKLRNAHTTEREAPGGYVYAYTIGVQCSPLDTAAIFGQTAVIRLLLEAGADPNRASEEWKMTPLTWAVYHNHREAALLLLQAGADPNVVSAWGRTAFHYAIERKDQELIQALRKAGASENPSNEGN